MMTAVTLYHPSREAVKESWVVIANQIDLLTVIRIHCVLEKRDSLLEDHESVPLALVHSSSITLVNAAYKQLWNTFTSHSYLSTICIVYVLVAPQTPTQSSLSNSHLSFQKIWKLKLAVNLRVGEGFPIHNNVLFCWGIFNLRQFILLNFLRLGRDPFNVRQPSYLD